MQKNPLFLRLSAELSALIDPQQHTFAIAWFYLGASIMMAKDLAAEARNLSNTLTINAEDVGGTAEYVDIPAFSARAFKHGNRYFIAIFDGMPSNIMQIGFKPEPHPALRPAGNSGSTAASIRTSRPAGSSED